MPHVYRELRRLAARKMAGEKPGQTLQATALVHEAWIKLVRRGKVTFFVPGVTLQAWMLLSSEEKGMIALAPENAMATTAISRV